LGAATLNRAAQTETTNHTNDTNSRGWLAAGCAAPVFVCARHTPSANIAEYIAQIFRKYCAQTNVQTKTQSKFSGILMARKTGRK